MRNYNLLYEVLAKTYANTIFVQNPAHVEIFPNTCFINQLLLVCS